MPPKEHISDEEAAWLTPKIQSTAENKPNPLLKGLIDLLAKCTIYQLEPDSKVYFLLRDDGQWFISTEYFPGQVVVRECEISDSSLKLAMTTLLQLESGAFDGC